MSYRGSKHDGLKSIGKLITSPEIMFTWTFLILVELEKHRCFGSNFGASVSGQAGGLNGNNKNQVWMGMFMCLCVYI